MPGQRKIKHTSGRALQRVGAGLGAGALVAGLLVGPLQSARGVDLVDWYGHEYGGQGTAQTTDATSAGDPATSAESRGVVLINTEIYTGSEAAGTGMVLNSSGIVLTNYHVVEGSTAIKVTVASTGRTYTAKVVGADQKSDIAVLKLSGASGLATATIDRNALDVGDRVTAVGNAGGTGTLTQAKGKVTALDQKISTQAEDTVAGETLTGLIQTNANVQPGDSGGPLLDGQDEVTGIDAAASSGGATQGYAIPITTALRIAGQIESGKATKTVRIGPAAYLGIEVTTASAADQSSDDQGGWNQGGWNQDWGQGGGWGWGQNGGGQNGWDQGGSGSGGWGSYDAPSQNSSGDQVTGAQIVQVEQGTPAADAGLTAGDVITRVGTTTITSADKLTSTLKNYRPGDKVTVGWTDQSGQQHTTSVTLGASPVN